MIEGKNITKKFKMINGQSISVFENVNFQISRGESVGFLGLNGGGKSTLCKIISGSEPINSGTMIRTLRTSWPIGVFTCLSPQLTGYENIEFISHAYGVDSEVIIEQVRKYGGISGFLDKQISAYSAGMRAKLAFFMAYSIDFDIYICDEVTAVGDIHFREIADAIFDEIKEKKGLILTSHNIGNIIRNVDYVYILGNKDISKKYDVLEGVEVYKEMTEANG